MGVEIPRVLQTMVGQNSSEAWLVTGRPLMFRIDGALREAVLTPLTEEDAELVLANDPKLQAAFEKTGMVEFRLKFGRDASFHVTTMAICGMPLTVIRRVQKPRKTGLFNWGNQKTD